MPEATLNGIDAKSVLRGKILGVKIRYARTRAGLSQSEVGEALGVAPHIIDEIETGQRDITLPQLEVIAYLFGIPVLYFWSEEPFEEKERDYETIAAMTLRERIIAILLRQARMEAGRSQVDLARLLAVPEATIAAYESGEHPIPLRHLEVLGDFLNVSVAYFVDKGLAPADAGGREATLEEIAQFSQLPVEVREFLLNPANLLYLNIAMRLSDLSAETLRSLAEGLLEVTY